MGERCGIRHEPTNRVDEAAGRTPGGRNRRARAARGAVRGLGALLAVALLAVPLQACGLQVPVDPGGTLEKVEGGTLRVGLSPEPGMVDVSGEQPTGPLVDAAEHVAAGLDAEPKWVVRGEEGLVVMLERGELDLALGGFTEDTPWVDRVAVSRAFDRLPGAEDRKVVVLTRMGENAFLSEVERILDEESAS